MVKIMLLHMQGIMNALPDERHRQQGNQLISEARIRLAAIQQFQTVGNKK